MIKVKKPLVLFLVLFFASFTIFPNYAPNYAYAASDSTSDSESEKERKGITAAIIFGILIIAGIVYGTICIVRGFEGKPVKKLTKIFPSKDKPRNDQKKVKEDPIISDSGEIVAFRW